MYVKFSIYFRLQLQILYGFDCICDDIELKKQMETATCSQKGRK
jgi:hypothetical protein